jgi:uncharacterized protein (DUF1697 family)
MIKQIAILRGINVGGRRKLLMADLKELSTQIGLSNVSTYIQSGNVLFESSEKPKVIAEKLKKAIKDQFDYDVPVIVISLEELIHVRSENPYINEPEIKQLHYTFLESQPETDYIDNLKTIDVSPDSFVIKDRTVYINCLKGYGTSKLTNDFFEKKLKITATTRNAKTLNKLIELATV